VKRGIRTPPRSIRVPDDLWRAAMAVADERGESITDVLRRALERYVRTGRPQEKSAPGGG
jgi:antitoxin component of RelBE/YafQ-DinJ toxin-antitoxin module